MTDIKKDIEAATHIINGNYLLVNGKIYSPIYPWTNERIDKYADIDLDNKHVLTVTSSFDHALYAIYNGATDIDCFDKNRLCKYYADLKRALILRYDEEKVRSILDFKIDTHNYREFKMHTSFSLKQLRELFILPDTYQFWSTLLNDRCFRHNNHRLFRSDGYPSYNLPPFNELKEKLAAASISFYDTQLASINLYIDQQIKYDAIFISNILDFNHTEETFISIYNRLNDNGLLYDYHIARGDRDYSIEPIKIIPCNERKQVCKIYQKKFQTKN